jgi:branched-chain amino acid transport system substrate-binding protein
VKDHKNLLLRVALLAVAVLAIVAIGACGGDDEGSDGGGGVKTVNIGAALALSGDYAIFDQPLLDGLKLGIEDVNKEGAILGKYKLKLNLEDMRSDVGQAVVTVKSLLDADNNFILLPCQSDPAIAAGRLAQQKGIPAMTTCATSPDLRSSTGDFVFGNYPADNFDATATATYALKKHYKTAFLISSSDSAYTENIPKYFGKVFEDGGGEIVGRAEYSTSQQDFGALVTRIENASPQPDVINTGMYEPAFPAFMKQLRGAGVDIPVIAAGGIDTQSVAELGKVVEGVVYAVPAYLEKGSEVANLYDRLIDRFGQERTAGIWGALGYDAALIIKGAIEKAGGTDPKALRDAVASLKDYQGIQSKITFDWPSSNGYPLRTMYLVRLQDNTKVLIDEVPLTPDIVPEAF